MPAFTSTCRCCTERLSTTDLDAAWTHFLRHSDDGHDARFRRTAMTRAHTVTAEATAPVDTETHAD